MYKSLGFSWILLSSLALSFFLILFWFTGQLLARDFVLKAEEECSLYLRYSLSLLHSFIV